MHLRRYVGASSRGGENAVPVRALSSRTAQAQSDPKGRMRTKGDDAIVARLLARAGRSAQLAGSPTSAQLHAPIDAAGRSLIPARRRMGGP
jgi:hypothetical protein